MSGVQASLMFFVTGRNDPPFVLNSRPVAVRMLPGNRLYLPVVAVLMSHCGARPCRLAREWNSGKARGSPVLSNQRRDSR
jgi:hypothetical protein